MTDTPNPVATPKPTRLWICPYMDCTGRTVFDNQVDYWVHVIDHRIRERWSPLSKVEP